MSRSISKIKTIKQQQKFMASQNKTEIQGIQQQKQKQLGQLETVQQGEPITQELVKSKSQTCLQDQERLKFVRNMQRQRRLIQKRKKIKLEEQRNKLQKQLQNKRQQDIKKVQNRKDTRKQQIKSYLQKMKEDQSQREIQTKRSNNIIKSLKSQKTLQNKMQDKFLEFQNRILSEQKMMLAKRRQIFKPLQKSQFEQHLQKISELKKSRTVLKHSSQKHFSTKKNYKSEWYKRVLKQQNLNQINQKSKQMMKQLKQLKDKQQKYADYIKVNFIPQVDPKKKILSTKKPILKSLRQTIFKKGLQNLKFAKQHKINQKSAQKSKQNPQNYSSTKLARPIDYLDMLKRERLQSKSQSKSDYIQKIKNSKNLTKQQKITKIIEYADQLQLKAKRKEQLSKYQRQKFKTKTQNLIDVVNAKLRLLDKIS